MNECERQGLASGEGNDWLLETTKSLGKGKSPQTQQQQKQPQNPREREKIRRRGNGPRK